MALLEDMLLLAMSVPLGDPNDDNCVWGLPLLIWGNPGSGKSSRIRRLGIRMNLHTGVILPSGRLPEDFAGLPVMDGRGGVNVVSVLKAIRELAEIGEGVLFIDEINTARGAVQSTLLGVVQDRRSGDVEIPPRVRIIAAANPVENSAGGIPIAAPLANRFVHHEHQRASGQEWGNWLMGISTSDDEEIPTLYDVEKTVKAKWQKVWMETTSIFAGFAHRFNSELEVLPEVGSEDRSKAYPTLRTWELAARASATCKALNLGGMIESRMIKGCVGDAGRDMFIKYRTEAALPSATEVLRDGFEPDKKRLDRSYAVYMGLVAHIVSLPHKEAQLAAALKAWPILEKACEGGIADLVHPAVIALVDKGLGSMGGEKMAKAAAPVLSRFDEKLRARAKAASKALELPGRET